MKINSYEISNQQNEVKKVRNRICSWAMLISIGLASFFLFVNEKAFAKGLVLGTCFSCINFLLLGRSILMTIGQSHPRAKIIAFTSLLARYVILAIPLIVAVKSSSFNLVTTIIGIFSIQIVTLVYYVVMPLLFHRKE